MYMLQQLRSARLRRQPHFTPSAFLVALGREARYGGVHAVVRARGVHIYKDLLAIGWP